MNINLIWCHGSLSQPWGAKSKTLAETASRHELAMDAPDFQDLENPDGRVERLLAHMGDSPAILAGSSMGGYVACAAARQANVLGLFLLAPAFYFQGYDIHVFSNLPKTISIMHGWDDDVIPVDNSIRFARQHKADLHIVNDGHRLTSSIPQANEIFSHFLETVKSRHGEQPS